MAGTGGTGGTSGSGVAAGVPLEELPESYAAALCEAYLGCYGTLYAIFRPGEECVKNVTVQLQEELATLPHAVESGSVVYDGVAAQACIDEIAAGGCETLDQRASTTCQAVLVGSAAEDADCELDEECEAGLYCSIGDTCPGTCTPLEAAGRACNESSQCRSGLTCGTTGVCVAPAKLGEPCKQGEPDCSGGSICLGDSEATNTPGECVAIDDAFSGEAGDACNFTELCAAGVPSVLVPLIVSTTSHQRDNAEWMAGQGAAIHLPQAELSPRKLADLLAGLTRDALLAMATKARALARPHAAARVADELERMVAA